MSLSRGGRLSRKAPLNEIPGQSAKSRAFSPATTLNGKHRIIKEVLVSKGSLTAAIVHPREVFAPAIKERASSIIVLHNHPSGDPSPSQEDIEITQRLKQVGELVGITLLDHVIIGTDFVSMQERNFI